MLVEDNHGNPLSVGRKTRVVPTAIRRALWARDKGCAFPSCGRRRFVEAHHVIHWSAGGETRLDNLMLMCSRHHGLLHEGGFTIEKDYRDRWFFRRPDGRAVPACGYRPEDITDDDIETASEYFDGHTSAEVSRTSAGAPHTSAESCRAPVKGVTVNEPSAEAWRVRELPAPIYRCQQDPRPFRCRGSASFRGGIRVRQPSAEGLVAWHWRHTALATAR